MPIVSSSFLPATLNEVVNKVNELEDIIDELKNNSQGNDGIDDLATDLQLLSDRIEALEVEFELADMSSLESVQDELSTLRDEVADASNQLDNMQESIDAFSDIEGRVENLENTVAELQSSSSEGSSEEISNLQSRVDEIGTVTDEFFDV